MYGSVVDTFSDGGPYLWVFWQGGGQSEAQLERLSIPNFGIPANLQFDVESDLGLAAGAKAGGMFITDELVPGEITIGGLVQGDPDVAFAYQLDPNPAEIDVSLNSGSLLNGLYQVPKNHAQQLLFTGSATNLGSDTIDLGHIETSVYNNGTLEIHRCG